MIKTLTKLVLLVIIINGMDGAYNGFRKATKGTIIKNTFVKSISFKKFNHKLVYESLKVFNRTSIKLIKSEGLRPVFIFDTETAPANFIKSMVALGKKETLLAAAFPYLNFCVIIVNTDKVKTKEELKIVLIHEWLHCNFYKHSVSPKDIMYPWVDYTDGIYKDSIDYYLIDMLREVV